MTDREYVIRPDGKRWAFDSRYPRSVVREDTADGPVVLVIRTHDLELAARMAEVRWNAYHPGVPMPEGELEWRRQEKTGWCRTGGSDFYLGPSTGTETRACPVVAFRRPAEAEGAA